MNNNDYEHQYRQFRRRRRRHAIREMLVPGTLNGCRSEYNLITSTFVWFKTFTCLVLNRIKPINTGDDICAVVSYDMVYDVDHYEWTSVFVNPSFFKSWHVSIENDGE